MKLSLIASSMFLCLVATVACSTSSEPEPSIKSDETVSVESKKPQGEWICSETECCEYLFPVCEADANCSDNIVILKCVQCKEEKHDAGYKCPKRFEDAEED